MVGVFSCAKKKKHPTRHFDPLGYEQKNVIIQRDRLGYGLRISGDNPVLVFSVREGSAAHRAGININDQIIKVATRTRRVPCLDKTHRCETSLRAVFLHKRSIIVER
jgi:C-terminal processing protease CtpA/Prc